jgi:hypothetical protein
MPCSCRSFNTQFEPLPDARLPGSVCGLIVVADDFDKPLPEFEKL